MLIYSSFPSCFSLVLAYLSESSYFCIHSKKQLVNLLLEIANTKLKRVNLRVAFRPVTTLQPGAKAAAPNSYQFSVFTLEKHKGHFDSAISNRHKLPTQCCTSRNTPVRTYLSDDTSFYTTFCSMETIIDRYQQFSNAERSVNNVQQGVPWREKLSADLRTSFEVLKFLQRLMDGSGFPKLNLDELNQVEKELESALHLTMTRKVVRVKQLRSTKRNCKLEMSETELLLDMAKELQEQTELVQDTIKKLQEQEQPHLHEGNIILNQNQTKNGGGITEAVNGEGIQNSGGGEAFTDENYTNHFPLIPSSISDRHVCQVPTHLSLA